MSNVAVTFMNRRRLLGAGLSLMAGAALPRLSLGAAQLADSLVVLDDVGANVVALRTSDGLVLVDSGAPSATDTLLKHVDSMAEGKLAALFNTHWHEEQVGGNVALGERGIEIIAHAKTRTHLSVEYYVPPEARYHKPLPAKGIPQTVFYMDAESRTIGGNHIEYGYLRQAHTDGDIYVFFRDQNVLAVGDVASPERDPALDWYGGGWLGGRVDAMTQLLALANDDTRIVPAFGKVMSRAELQAERDMMVKLFERTTELTAKGHSARDMLEVGALDVVPRRFEDPYRFLYDVAKGLQAHYTNFAGNVV